jgi:exodeoxyribonuclease-3
MMKVASFNVNSIRSRLPIVLGWLKKESPDALCIQETKTQDEFFPKDAFASIGYYAAFRGQKAYNGVAILSRLPFDDVKIGFDSDESEGSRLITATVNGIPIINAYIPQGSEPDSEKFQYKLQWFERFLKHIQTRYSPDEPLLWVGDFNVAPEPIDVYDPVNLDGHVCYHPAVRQALNLLKDWGFVDVFRLRQPEPHHYTFWDYRVKNAISRKIGWRIDHIWATKPLAQKTDRAWIDIEPRRYEKPSDHTIIAAEFMA